eukprot:g45891.t1
MPVLFVRFVAALLRLCRTGRVHSQVPGITFCILKFLGSQNPRLSSPSLFFCLWHPFSLRLSQTTTDIEGMEFFPPAEELSLGPQLFMMMVYGFILCYCSKLIGSGCDILLDIYQEGVVGGLLLPVLGAVPDGMIILISGIGGTKEEIQEQIKVGVGTLAGSTIMLLTVPWSIGVFLNRREMDPLTGKAARDKIVKEPKPVCPIFAKSGECPMGNEGPHRKSYLHDHGHRKNKFVWKPKLPAKLDLYTNVATVLHGTPVTAKTMMLTSLTYLVIQIPAFFYDHDPDQGAKRESKYALAGMLTATICFFTYCWYQLNNESHLEMIAKRQEKVHSLHHWLEHPHRFHEGFHALGGTVEQVFAAIDVDNDGYLNPTEVKKGLQALGLQVMDEEAETMLKMMDTDGDGEVNEEEWELFVSNYLDVVSTKRLRALTDNTNSDGKQHTENLQIKKVAPHLYEKLEQWHRHDSLRFEVHFSSKIEMQAIKEWTEMQAIKEWAQAKDNVTPFVDANKIILTRPGGTPEVHGPPKSSLPLWARASRSLVEYSEKGGEISGLITEFATSPEVGLTKDDVRKLVTKYRISQPEHFVQLKYLACLPQGKQTLGVPQLQKFLEAMSGSAGKGQAPSSRTTSGQEEVASLLADEGGVRQRGVGHGISSYQTQDNETAVNIASSAAAEDEDDEEEEEEEAEFADWTEKEKERYAIFLLCVGTTLVTIFSDPMVDVINQFGKTAGIDPFYISFVITPLASNASEVIAGLMIAAKKTNASMAVTASVLYGAATMNNTFCLAIFLGLVYFQGLSWNFSAEVISILVVTYCVGMVGLKTTYKLWHALFIFLLFPMSLLLIWTLENVFGLQ